MIGRHFEDRSKTCYEARMSPISREYQRAAFFDDGISFACTQCGRCCTGETGTIYVTRSELTAIAGYLQVRKAEVIARDLYPFKDSYSIRELPDGRCRFFQDGCTIYAVRPFQCRSFPFWFDNLRSAARWDQVRRMCPGVGQGRRFSKEEIMVSALATRHI
jgi:uncharacterized protein